MLYDRYFSNKEKYKARRLGLRLKQTKAEYVLWQELRGKKAEHRFRRQFQIGPYIVDFYCHKLKLIIEVDGPVHDEQIEYDKKRSKFLKNRNFTIIRFTNNQVLFDRENVMESIVNECNRLSK